MNKNINFKRKSISLLLILTLLITMAVPAFAHTNTDRLYDEPANVILGDMMTIEEAIAQGFKIVCISEILIIDDEHIQSRAPSGWFHLSRGNWTFIGNWPNNHVLPQRINITNGS